VPTNTATVAGKDGAKELAEIVAAVARCRRDAEAAIASKDAARLKTAVAAIATAERRGGEILIKVGGRLKPLPVSQAVRKRWREAAARSPKAFEMKLRRDVAKAVARIGGDAVDAATMNKAKSHSRPPVSTRLPAKSSSREPPHAKLSNWHQEPDGSLTRTLTSVEGDAVGAPAGTV
jgi:hypothetical protein